MKNFGHRPGPRHPRGWGRRMAGQGLAQRRLVTRFGKTA